MAKKVNKKHVSFNESFMVKNVIKIKFGITVTISVDASAKIQEKM